MDSKDRLPNLQLLHGPDNQSKNDQMPAEWIKETYKKDEGRKDYISRHVLDGVMTDLSGFGAFFKGRRQRLPERILVVLNGIPPEILQITHSRTDTNLKAYFFSLLIRVWGQ
jgi:hypothetical protein